MTTPWTPDRTETLARMKADGATHRRIACALGVTRNAISGKLFRLRHATPPRRPEASFDVPAAAALYRAGWTYAEIAARIGRSKMTVCKHLKRHGVVSRPRISTGLSPLAREILHDLGAPEFGGAATAEELTEWLGEPRDVVERALTQLVARGRVTESNGRISTDLKAVA